MNRQSLVVLVLAAVVVAAPIVVGTALTTAPASQSSGGASAGTTHPKESLQGSLSGDSQQAAGLESSAVTASGTANAQSTVDDGPVENTSWRIDIGTDTIGTGGPTVTNDYVVQVVDDPSTLRVRYRDNGSLHGTFDTGSTYEGVLGSATVHSGTAYFGIGRTLYAVSLSDMTEQWNVTFERGEIWSTPTYDDGVVYAGAGDAHAVHASNGTTKWRFDVGDYRLGRQPAVVNDRAYLVDDVGELHVVDADTGTELWNVSESTVNTAQNSQPVVYDGDVFVALDGTLYRLKDDGGTVWQYDLPAASSGIAVDDSRVYASTLDGVVEAVDAENGTQEWRYTTPEGGSVVNDQKGAPFVTGNGVVYVSVTGLHTGNGSTVAIDTADGSETWRLDSQSMFGGDVTHYGNAIYVNHGSGVEVFDGSTT